MAKSKKVEPVSRNGEFALGLTGGIFGFLGGLFALVIGGLSDSFEDSGFESGEVSGEQVIGLGWVAILAAGVGIAGAALVKSNNKLAGWLMIVSAIAGLIAISIFYLLPAALLIAGGLMALLRGSKVSSK